jgi:hypothetical protein
MVNGQEQKCPGCGRRLEQTGTYCPSCVAERNSGDAEGAEGRETCTLKPAGEARKRAPISLGISYSRLMKIPEAANNREKTINTAGLKIFDFIWIGLICLLFLILSIASAFFIFVSGFSDSAMLFVETIIITLFTGFLFSLFFSNKYPGCFWLWGIFFMIIPLTVGMIGGKSDSSSTLKLKLIWTGFSIFMYLSTLAGGLIVKRKKQKRI